MLVRREGPHAACGQIPKRRDTRQAQSHCIPAAIWHLSVDRPKDSHTAEECPPREELCGLQAIKCRNPPMRHIHRRVGHDSPFKLRQSEAAKFQNSRRPLWSHGTASNRDGTVNEDHARPHNPYEAYFEPIWFRFLAGIGLVNIVCNHVLFRILFGLVASRHHHCQQHSYFP